MDVGEFLAAFFPDAEQCVFLRTFKPKGAPPGFAYPKTLEITRSKLVTDKGRQQELLHLNENAGIYFVVNAGGNSDDEITQFSAFYIENDDISIEEQHRRLDAAAIQPSIRVVTRKSVHAYWLLAEALTRDYPALLSERSRLLKEGQKREADWIKTATGESWLREWQKWQETETGKDWRNVAEQWTSTQKEFIAFFNSDRAVHNPSRLMRLPFFDHLHYNSELGKVERQQVEVHTFEPGRRFTIEEIHDAFGVIKSQTTTELSVGKKSVSFEYYEDRHAELVKRITDAAKRNRHGNYEMRCPAHDGKGETSLVYFPASDAVFCNAKCNYFLILDAFGLSMESLPNRDKKQTSNTYTEFELHEKAFHGIAGEFVRLVAPNSEADEAALLVQFLCAFGNAVGRNAHFTVEADRHYLNLFVLLVGGTSSGRKGTSWGYVQRIFRSIDEVLEKDCLVSGLSSGEGLIYRVRDPIIQRKKDKKDPSKITEIETDSGVQDKRLLVKEGEFAQVLRVQGRESNTLSAMLRNFWDSGTHSNLVKNSPIKTTNAYISIIGHITAEEFISSLYDNETVNGYLNRFLMIRSRRSKLLPFGANISDMDFGWIVRETYKAKEFAEDASEICLSDKAKELWAKIYVPLETSRSGTLAKVTQRASPYVLRVACIYALLDLKNVVNVVHLQAALAVWQYAENTARGLFGGKVDNKNANRLLDAMRKRETGFTQTDVRDFFNRNLTADDTETILLQLVSANLIYQTKELTEGAKKPTKIWHVNRKNITTLDDINDIYDIYLNEERDSDSKVVNVVNSVQEKAETGDMKIIRLEREAIRDEHLYEPALQA